MTGTNTFRLRLFVVSLLLRFLQRETNSLGLDLVGNHVDDAREGLEEVRVMYFGEDES